MHKKEAKYVVNLTNKNIALDGRYVEKFSILYLGTKVIKQWDSIYSALLNKGKIMIAKTHDEAMDILKTYLPKRLVSPALRRNASLKTVDNIKNDVKYNESIKRYTTSVEHNIAGSVDKPVVVEMTPEAVEPAIIDVMTPEAIEPATIETLEEVVETAPEVVEEIKAEVTEDDSFGLAGEEPSSEVEAKEEVSEETTLDDLKAKAKLAGIKGYAKMSKGKLEEALNKESK